MINRTFPIIAADDLDATKRFYVELLGFDLVYDSDWFIDLQAPGNPLLEIAVWRADHELVPPGLAGPPKGVMIDVVVDDVDRIYAAATESGLQPVIELRDEPYGQRRFVVRDPAGTLVEISTPIAPDPELIS
jgi:catechol 2,3-dioxygenase-like lactoylglutathione lyase family enzyme